MKELTFKFVCLEGEYTLKTKIENEKLFYSIETSIASLENKEGEIDSTNFEAIFDSVHIERWDKDYPASGSKILDATKWEVEYIADNKRYHSKGEEGYWPYFYDKFIDALLIIDNNANYFK